MKRSYRSSFLWGFIFWSLLFSACSEQPKKRIQFNNHHFETNEIEGYFHRSSQVEKLELLSQIFKNKYKNPADFEKWVKQRFILEYPKHRFTNVEALKRTLVSMYQSEYFELAASFSAKVIDDKRIELKGAKPSALALMAGYYDLTQDRDSLSYFLHELGQHLKDDSSSWLRIFYHTNKANVSSHQSRYLDALLQYKKALSYTTQDDIDNLRLLHLNLALLYLKIENSQKARFHVNKVKLLGLANFPVDKLNNLGVVLFKTKEFATAEKAFLQALNYARKEKQAMFEAQTLSNLANLRRKEKRFDEALELMLESDKICLDLGVEMGVFINQLNRAELYGDCGSYSELATELSMLEKKIFELNEPSYTADWFRLCYQLNDALGNEALANQFYRKYHTLRESFLGDRDRNLLSEWEIIQMREGQNRERIRLKLAIQQQKNNKLFLTFLFMLFLVIASLGFILLSRRTHKNRIEQLKIQQRLVFDLELKSKELLAESLKNISVQHLKEDLNTALEHALSELTKPHHDKFANLQRMLKTVPAKGFLDEFETRFKGVHEVFYKNLKVLAPNLTPHEVRICALMRLNISSKEMAILTNRTQGTIDNTRSLIRKKLKLEEQVNLQEFILSI